MSRAEVLSAIGDGPISASGGDSVRVVQGFRRMRYLVAGKSFEVIYVRDQPGDVRELVVDTVETPRVLGDDKLMGWGWKYYRGAMKELGLPNPIIHVDSTKPPAAPAASPAPKQPGE